MTSTQLSGAARSPIVGGVAYYLPKRVLSLDIWQVKVQEAEASGGNSLPDAVVIDPSGKAKPEPPPRPYFATMGELQTIPDRNYLMRLSQDPSASFHDTVEVKMTADGLLTSVSSLVTDEGPKIVASLARLAKLAAGVPDTTKSSGVESGGREVTFEIVGRLVVDPTDPADAQSLHRRYGIRLEAAPMISGTDPRCVLTPAGACEPVCAQSGVCYRPVVPYSIKVTPSAVVTPPKPGAKGSISVLPEGIQEIYMLPNRSPVVCLPIDRVPFVTSKFKVAFEDGLLTEMSSDKPSEILGFLQIPLTIARAIVSVPGELLQVKVTNTGNVAKAAESEKKAFETLQALERSKRGE
jgi:hypothetical protein